MILITGASGFVGRHLLANLQRRQPLQEDVLPVYLSSAVDGGVQVNLSDPVEVEALFGSYKVNCVIHLAAEARPGFCQSDPAAARLGNTVIVQNLLRACRASGCYFICTSTDMVFKGDRALYHEQDVPDPINVYGRVKSEAEAQVQQYAGPWCIVRPALIYGSEIGGRSSFLSWMLEALKQGTGEFFTDEFRSPVWVNNLVHLLVEVVKTKQQGILHAGGLDCLSRVEFAEMTADIWDISRSSIKTTGLDADAGNSWRPRRVCLASEMAHTLVPFTPTRVALEQIRAAMSEGTAGGHQ